MPNGIVIVRWDDKLGVVIEGMYPRGLKINEDQVMRIFTTHAMGGGEAGFLSMTIENLSIASYYSGLPEEGRSQYYVALLLQDDENADIFEDPLTEISKLLIDHVKDKYFEQFLAKEFEDIQKLTVMTEEQRYSMIQRDERRVLVLTKLGLGPIYKDELRKWLSDQLGEEVLDLEAILSPFFKTHMIHELPMDKPDGSQNSCLFLIKDVFVMRSPVEKFYKISKAGTAPSEMKKVFEDYREEVDSYFGDYKFGDADSIIIAEVVADPSSYNLITILRNNYVEINQLSDIYEKPLDQIINSINELKRLNVINEIKDKRGNKWIFLKSDIVFPTFFPEYLVDSIRRRWMEKGIDQNLALKHLELLKSVYRGEEEELAVSLTREEKALIVDKLPKKKAKIEIEAAPEIKTMSDEELFKLVERVNILRKEAKMDLDNKDRKLAYNKLREAIKITENLIAAGAVGQEKRLEKLEKVAMSVERLLGKDETKKIEAPISTPEPLESSKVMVDTKRADFKMLRDQRDSAIASADKALSGGNFQEAVSFLENAAELSERMGETDKATDIRKMASDIKSKLEKLAG